MRIKSLSDKIVLYFVIIGISAIAVVSTYSFYNSKAALLNRTFDQLTSVRVVKKGQIEQFFNDRLADLALVIHSFESHFQTSPGFYSGRKTAGQKVLWEHLQKSGYYKGAWLYVGNDEILKKTSEENRPSFFVLMEANVDGSIPESLNTSSLPMRNVIHDFVWDSIEGTPRLFVSGPLEYNYSDRQFWVAMEISIEAINKIMLEKNPADGMGLSGESYLVGSDRLMRSTSRFHQNSIMQTRVETFGVQQAFTGHTGTSVINDYRGIKVLSSYSKLKIPGLDWAILAEIDYKEATSSIYRIRNNILLITIFMSVIVFIISYMFSKRITSPLIKLKDATQTIQEGNLDVALPRIKNDEIGQLTNSFNSMANTLKEKEVELQHERNKRFTAMIDGQELERQRLSRELHDGLGQSVIALKLKLESIDAKDTCQTQRTLKDVKNTFDGTISEIRRISNDLMPAVLSEFGLITALKNICNDITENTPIDVKYSYKGSFSDLDRKTTIYFFRILQEALNNLVKHSGATHAEVLLNKSVNKITVVVKDNGKGFDREATSYHSGSGIPNMHERLRLLEGEIDIQSKPGQGTTIKIEIPIIDGTYSDN